MSDVESVNKAKERYSAWCKDKKALAIIYPEYRQPQLQAIALAQDAYTLADAYISDEANRARIAAKKRPATELDLVSLGFRLSSVDANANLGKAADKCWSWQIYDKHYSPEEPHSHIVAAIENGVCTLWLESYDAAGKTLALTELQRKNWTVLQIEELLNGFRE